MQASVSTPQAITRARAFCISAFLCCPRQRPWPRSLTGRCMASEPCGLTTFASEPAPSLFIISKSCMWPSRTTDQKEENMDMVARSAIIGIDVSRDWLDIHCLPDNQRLRLPNTAERSVRLIHNSSYLLSETTLRIKAM